MDSLQEISQFLDIKTRLDLKAVSLQHVLGVTGSKEGRELLLGIPAILRQLILLLQDQSAVIAKDAALALVNISGDEEGANALLIISESSGSLNKNETDDLIYICLKHIIDQKSKLADPCCMILSNITRPHNLPDRFISLVEKSDFKWTQVLNAFIMKDYNVSGAKLHYLGPVFSNLSQSKKFREYLTDPANRVLHRLLPFLEYPDSIVRRGGVAGALKNCCFDIERHDWLLSPEIDVLTYLLLPLAGPEEFTDEENDKLPEDLQWLPETKKREPDPDIRIILLEALGQLCATKKAREYLREKNAYIILRELHKWEKDRKCLLSCENVVDILIKTEEEIGLDNFKEVEVPEEYHEKFQKMDEDYLKDEEEEEKESKNDVEVKVVESA